MQKVEVEVNVDTQNSVKTLTSLNTQIENLKNEIEGTDIGSDRFKELSSQLQKAQSEVANLEKGFEAVDNVKLADSFVKLAGGITNSFASIQASMQLFGSDNEELNEAMLKANQLMIISNGAKAVSEAVVEGAAARRLIAEKAVTFGLMAQASAQKAYNIVVGQSTGVLKVFRLGLLSLGIPALVIAISYLVANWDELSKTVSENSQKIKEITNRFGWLLPPVYMVVKAFEALGKVWDWLKNNANDLLVTLNLVDSAEEKLVKTTEKNIESTEKKIKKREQEIELLKIQGTEDSKLRQLEIQNHRERLTSYIDFINAKKLAGQSITDEEQQQLEDLSYALKKAKTEDYYTTLKEKEDAIKIEQEKNKKIADERKKSQDEKDRLAEEAKDKELAIQRELEDERLKGIEDTYEREIKELTIQYQRRIDAIVDNSANEIALRKQLQNNLYKELDAIEQKRIDDENQKSVEKLQKEYEDADLLLQAKKLRMETEGQETFEVQKEIENKRYEYEKSNKQLTNAELEYIEAVHQKNLLTIEAEANEQKKKEEEEIFQAKIKLATLTSNGLTALADLTNTNSAKQSKFQKAVAVANIAVEQAMSIATAIRSATQTASSYGPAAAYATPILIATVVGSVLSGFASIRNVLKGSDVSIPQPSLSLSSVPTSTGQKDNSINGNAPIIARNAQASTELNRSESNGNNNGSGGVTNVNVSISETEITKTQNKVSEIENLATF